MSTEETELVVLGALLLGDRSLLEAVRPLLDADHFSREEHRHVFRAYLALEEQDEPIDIVTVQDELMRRGVLTSVGGYPFLMTLAEQVPIVYGTERARADARRIRGDSGPRGAG